MKEAPDLPSKNAQELFLLVLLNRTINYSFAENLKLAHVKKWNFDHNSEKKNILDQIFVCYVDIRVDEFWFQIYISIVHSLSGYLYMSDVIWKLRSVTIREKSFLDFCCFSEL